MDYLIVVYTGKNIYSLSLKPGVTATAGNSQNDTLFIDNPALNASHLVLACDAGGVRVLSRSPMKFGDDELTNRVLSAGDIITITEKISLAVFEAGCSLNAAVNIEGFDEIRIGRSYNNNDIALKDANVSTRHAVLQRINGQWTVTDLQSRNGTFANGKLVLTDEDAPAENINIFICGYVFYIQNNMLRFTNAPAEIEFTPEITDALVQMPARQKRYPFFQRSPRIRGRTDRAEFEIVSPPNTGNKPNISWLTGMMISSIPSSLTHGDSSTMRSMAWNIR